MLQIRLSNKATASESGGGAKQASGETVTVACPDHLVLAELSVAKTLSSVSGVTLVKTVGRRSRRLVGERVHFCVRCDFPVAIYGRLIPCEHALCLDCARSDSICYLCDDRIQKIQTVKLMEGIFICAAPNCLKSFLKKPDFEAHIHAVHPDLVNPNESEKKQTNSDSTVQAPTPKPLQDGQTPPMLSQQQNFVVPVNSNVMGPTSFGQPLYIGGGQGPETGVEQGSLMGYPQPFVDPCMMMNQSGLLAANPSLLGPPQPSFTQMPGNLFGGDLGSQHGQGYGWQQDKRDGFGNGQD